MPMTEPDRRTERITARITPRTARQIRDLAKRWGGVRPATPATVIEEAIDRAWRREHTREERP